MDLFFDLFLFEEPLGRGYEIIWKIIYLAKSAHIDFFWKKKFLLKKRTGLYLKLLSYIIQIIDYFLLQIIQQNGNTYSQWRWGKFNELIKNETR